MKAVLANKWQTQIHKRNTIQNKKCIYTLSFGSRYLGSSGEGKVFSFLLTPIAVLPVSVRIKLKGFKKVEFYINVL